MLIFHTAFTLFNIFGWALKKTRKIHFVTMTLTALSWLGLGYFFGWGYCFLTDWHWQIRVELGEPVPFVSYIQFLIFELTGYAPGAEITDLTTGIVAAVSYVACSILLWRDYQGREKRKMGETELPSEEKPGRDADQ